MEWILLSAYAVLLIAQICLLVRKRWTAAFFLALIGLAAAVVLTFVFDSLPGFGMMPGLTWFTEVISSMIAAAVYGIMMVVSLILWLAQGKK